MGARIAKAMAIASRITYAPPPRSRLLPRLPLPNHVQRMKKSASSATRPTSTTVMRHHADVVVADVRHLVRDHALQLAVVELVEQAARGGDGGVLRVAAGREGVRRAVLDDVHLRHRQAGADAEVLDDAIEVRLLLSRHLVRAADGERDAGAGVVAEQRVGDETGEAANGSTASGAPMM